MGKKKAKLEAKANAESKAKDEEAEEAKAKKSHTEEAVKPTKSHTEEAYRAAAVVFFTRDAHGELARVLVAVESRKVQAAWMGLDQKGKIKQRVVVFPMGRREKKDNGDPVETARREYVEETGDFGGLSKYLEFADFDNEESSDDDETAAAGKLCKAQSNMAVYMSPASMIVLFCEVPSKAASCVDRKATGGVPMAADEELPEGLVPPPDASTRQVRPLAAASVPRDDVPAEFIAKVKSKMCQYFERGDCVNGDKCAYAHDQSELVVATPKVQKHPAKRKRTEGDEGDAVADASELDAEKVPTYHVGQTDHVAPDWIDAAALRKAIESSEKAPLMMVASEECRILPTCKSICKLPHVRAWLGVKTEGSSVLEQDGATTKESAIGDPTSA